MSHENVVHVIAQLDKLVLRIDVMDEMLANAIERSDIFFNEIIQVIVVVEDMAVVYFDVLLFLRIFS